MMSNSIKIKKMSICDLSIFAMLIAMMAFKDFSKICVSIQIFTSLIIFLDVISKKTISKLDLKYVFYKFVFILFCFLSSLWGVNQSVIFHASMSVVLRTITGFAVIIYICDEGKLNLFLKFLIVSALILCIRMLIVVPMSAWGNDRVGNYLSHDINSGYENTGITFVLGFAITYTLVNTKIIKNSKLRFLLIGIMTFFSLMSGSKKQVIMLITNILVIAFLKSKNIGKVMRNTFISFFAIACFTILVFNNSYLYNVLGSRIESFFSTLSSEQKYSVDYSTGVDVSTSARLFLIKDALNVFKEHPVLGVGINCFKEVGVLKGKWAENNFVELLADVGLVGFVIYYSFSLWIIKSLKIRLRERNILDILLVACFINFLIINISMVTFMNNTLQLNFAILFAINKIRMNDTKKNSLLEAK